MRRGHPPGRQPPRWSNLLLFIGTAVAVLGTAKLRRQSIGWWALLLFIGRVLAQMIPIALHNRSVRRLPTTRIREVASDRWDEPSPSPVPSI